MAGAADILSVIGTRPEAIKMSPVIRALRKLKLEQRVLLTGQHPNLRSPRTIRTERLRLRLAHLSQGEIRDRMEDALIPSLLAMPPDLVIVQGDTTSALAGARAAAFCGIPVAHVEAGLRSFDRLQPWPEEDNRIAIDRISSLLFAPSDAAAANLSADPHIRGRVFVTGNSGIDALLSACRSHRPGSRTGGRRLLLVTCHRRENQGEGLVRIANALKRIVAASFHLQIMLPLHPNPAVRERMTSLLGGAPGISLIEPLDHRAMVSLMRSAWALLSDSGGIQEEGPALGVPVLVLRERTERPEAVESGNAMLVGTDPDRIVAAVRTLIEDPARYRAMATPRFPFGDGHSAGRIVAHIASWLDRRTEPVAAA